MTENPFLRPSSLPFGLPPFDRISEQHYRPAFELGMAEQLREVEAIVTNGEPATFENTLDALEASGQLLARVANVFFNLTSSATTEALSEIEAEIAPRLAAHSDAIHLDPRLFARISALAETTQAGATQAGATQAGATQAGATQADATQTSATSPEATSPKAASAKAASEEPPSAETQSTPDEERRRLLQRYLTDFRRAGATLPEPAQDRLKQINQDLSTLTTTFKNRLMAETNDMALLVTDPTELAGLSPDAIAAAAQAAAGRGLTGYLITLVLPSGQPALAQLTQRDLRRRLYQASIGRGLRHNEFDTRDTLTQIVSLRAERAELLGYPSHAAYAVEDQTAKTTEAVTTMLSSLTGPAAANARAEAEELTALLLADGQPGPLQPWDWTFYAEKLRLQRYAIDDAVLRPYLELNNVVTRGVFYAAGELYGLRFVRRHDLPSYHPDVETYEVLDHDGTAIGLFLADWFARDSKRGGAWMSTFVDQSGLLGARPVVTINLNIPKPAPGEPALLSTDEVDTAFHEFGHVLHGLFSDVRYPHFSGTSVPRDFVEFPSQVNEMWAWDRTVLAQYAVHHGTGEALPGELVERLLAAKSFGQGFATTEYLAATVLDWQWHLRGTDIEPVTGEQVEAFEQKTLQDHGLDIVLDGVSLIPPRYRSSYFAHIFAGGYSAGYYSYIWSEVLDADLVDWFTERGGLTRESGELFRRALLSRGGAVDPMEAFAAVRGRAPEVTALLVRRRLTGAPIG